MQQHTSTPSSSPGNGGPSIQHLETISSTSKLAMNRPLISRELPQSSSVLSHNLSNTKPERRSSMTASLQRLSSSNLIQRLSGSPKKPGFPLAVSPLSPQLQSALRLLRIHDVDDFERRFLSTDAFLTPWSHFRDHCLLQVKVGMKKTNKSEIKRTDILYWYTLFDEGRRRYDPAFDEGMNENANKLDMEKYGTIETSHWTSVEYEKLLYVWLLQTFQVGKSFNKHNFEYFELQNVCTAWEAVFIPIIEAVSADYNLKGRYHYGRLAKFIEEVRPSKLAFPDPNISTSTPLNHTPASSIGFISAPQKTGEDMVSVDPVTGVVTCKPRKLWNEDDQVLRDAFAKYGQLVERPKDKNKIEIWLKAQHAAIQRRRALEHLEDEARDFDPITIRLDDCDVTAPISDYHDAEGGKEPLSSPGYSRRRNDSNYSKVSITASPADRAATGLYGISDGLYSSIRTSNPWSDDDIFGPNPAHSSITAQNSEGNGMLMAETRPSPLYLSSGSHQRSQSRPYSLSHAEPILQRPSYEGSGYGPSPIPDLQEMNSSERVRQTRIPCPIKTPPYINETGRKYHPLEEHAVAVAETTPVNSEPLPIIRPKNPRRWNSHRGHVQGSLTAELAREDNILGPRIVSKENIRAALADISRENSTESILDDAIGDNKSRQASNGSVGDKHAFARIGGRGLNTGETPNLPTFNTHMFPRKRTMTHDQQVQLDASYEMELFRKDF